MTAPTEHPTRAPSTRTRDTHPQDTHDQNGHAPNTHDTHDPDTTAVITLLRAAVTTSGLTQAAFATAIGTSAPRLSTYLTGTVAPSARTLLRAHRLAHALATTHEHGLMSAPTTATAIRHHLRADQPEWAWRMLLQGRDHLRLLLHQAQDTPRGPHPPPEAHADDRPTSIPATTLPTPPGPRPVLLDAWEAAPTTTGHPGFDTLLAACTAHEHHTAGLTPPTWARPEPLTEPWAPQHPFLDPKRVEAQTPPWLRDLNIYIPHRDLNTA
ncbi:helix-turn-helix domain-containing protein [Kineococcus sp. SYSU DK018]|uniref:helix-turn-helix domain-containing protein n=1 Tax=Kineococcus sp. SYSU DK018 TaxID=3383139 RepID=UPI003D7ECF83